MAGSRFASSNQNIVEQLKENAKHKNTLKATQTWLNVWKTWTTERKVNPKIEEYEHEQLHKMLQIFYTELRTKDGCEYEPESLKSMLAALDRYFKENGYKYVLYNTRPRVPPVEIGTRRKSEVSPTTRQRQKTQRRECTDSRGRRNAME